MPNAPEKASTVHLPDLPVIEKAAFKISMLGEVIHLHFDTPDSKVNTLGRKTMGELGQLLRWMLERHAASPIEGLILTSGKHGQFIAGADLKELGALSMLDEKSAAAVIDSGQQLFNHLSQLPFPTVALVSGACMGGGTELILSMDDRLIVSHPAATIALPETKLGIIPAWGGTQRLPRLVGLNPAIEMITSGQAVSPEKAHAMGLVYDVIDTEKPQELVKAGLARIAQLRQDNLWLTHRKKVAAPLSLSEDQMRFSFLAARGAVMAQTQGHYPAPVVSLNALEEGIILPLLEALDVEKKHALPLIQSDVAANLIGLFFAEKKLGKPHLLKDDHKALVAEDELAVVGGGLMGSGIAGAFARASHPTSLVDLNREALDKSIGHIAKSMKGKIKIGRATEKDLVSMLGRINTLTSPDKLAGCKLIVEAVPEHEKLKTQLYQSLKPVMAADPEMILASNTSTLSISRMAESTADPSRFIGMHFFNPVDRMKLVEVIKGEKTEPWVVAQVANLVLKMRKTPVVVRDCPGFLVNRILMPYMNEALHLMTEGVAMDQIDKAATRFGMPMGPIALHDVVGLDTCLYAGKVLAAGYPERVKESPILGAMVKAERLGKKTGLGFRKMDHKGRVKPDEAIHDLLKPMITGDGDLDKNVITDRLFLTMLLEAIRALEEGIVTTPDELDMALILGIGFPPFRGGLLRWCDQQGADQILKRIEAFQELGARFSPPQLLIDMAREGKRFYPMPTLK